MYVCVCMCVYIYIYIYLKYKCLAGVDGFGDVGTARHQEEHARQTTRDSH